MSNYLEKDVGRVAEMLKALANPNRLRIFVRLASLCCVTTTSCCDDSSGETVGELGKGLGVGPSTVSHHLKELRHAGLIRTERRGQCIVSWVEPQTLEMLARFFGERISGVRLPDAEGVGL